MARMITLTDGPTLSVDESGEGRPVLLLHGGGGPATMANIAAHLAPGYRVLLATHPGWDGQPLPEQITRVADLAALYHALLRQEDLQDVVVIGSSIGGWMAAEMAATDADGRLGAVVLVDAGGIAVDGEPMPDFFSLDPRSIAEHTFHDPDRFFVDPTTLPPERSAAMRANMASLRTLAGEPYMHDPTLGARLADVAAPTLVVWGASDRVFTPGQGRAMAAAIPGARFELVAEAGHLPHLERPDAVWALLDDFLA